ncbi:MAG: two-component system, OmpR family, response regulator [Mycobacteriales bacterium]
MTRMLVVDDEERICRFLGRALRSAGYEVDSATSGTAALRAVRAHDYDLVVLDLMLPGVHGSEVLRRMLDERPDRRVLVLSAVTGVEARVGCLEAGAVDFLAKPFALAELLARIRSRMREARPPEPATATATPGYAFAGGPRELRVGDVRLDTVRRVLAIREERRPLSHREFAVLLHLMQRAGQVCTREELLSEVWGYSFDPGSNIVDVYIRRLRAKLDADQIETVRNVGYSFVA